MGLETRDIMENANEGRGRMILWRSPDECWDLPFVQNYCRVEVYRAGDMKLSAFD